MNRRDAIQSAYRILGKEATYSEIYRVLRPGGTFCGCFYVKGENLRTDWFIEKLYTPKGFFTPPYETAESLRQRLEQQYQQATVETVESMACLSVRNEVEFVILLIECIVACLLFTVVVGAVGLKDPLAGVHNWPPAIQHRARELGLIQSAQMAGSKKSMPKSWWPRWSLPPFAAIVYFFNGARSFAAGFGYSYLIWTVVNWYDFFIIDCLWVCHGRRLRIPGTEDMKEYQDYWFHFRASLRGTVIGLPVALLVDGLLLS